MEDERELSRMIRYYCSIGFSISRVAEKTGQTTDFICEWLVRNRTEIKKPKKVKASPLTLTQRSEAKRREDERLAKKTEMLDKLENQIKEEDIKGEDSLFCDTEFLERFFAKPLNKKECK